MSARYHVSASHPDPFPVVATGWYDTVDTDQYPHEVIAEYAEKHSADMTPGTVIVAHRERDRRNFTAVVKAVVHNPEVTLS